MKRVRPTLAVLFLLLIATRCAHFGTGDPLVVRAEDAEVNSLPLYEGAMNWHFAHSKQEAPALYEVFEKVRVEMPRGWRTLHKSVDAYKRTKDDIAKKDLLDAIKTVEDLVSQLQSVWGGH